jgi:hypothetical protein
MQRDYSIDSGAVALTAGSAKTVLAMKCGAVNPIDLIDFEISCDATAAGLLKVELITFSTANDGTGTAYTLKPWNGDGALVAAATAGKINYTVEPTSVTVIRTKVFVLPTEPAWGLLPLGREFTVPVSAAWGIRCTSTTVSPNVYISGVAEE